MVGPEVRLGGGGGGGGVAGGGGGGGAAQRSEIRNQLPHTLA